MLKYLPIMMVMVWPILLDNNRYTTLGEPLTLADAGIITYA